MTAGSAFLALAGPVGWTIAGVMLTGSVGSGLFASHKNKKTAEKLVGERENLEEIIRKFNNLNSEVKALSDITITQAEGLLNQQRLWLAMIIIVFLLKKRLRRGFL